MRLRKIAGAEETVQSHPRVLSPFRTEKNLLSLVDGKEIFLEIGMGKGDFAMGMAAREKEAIFLGMEKYPSVLIKALKKFDQNPQPNLWFLCENAENLKDMNLENKISGLFLNFSDPWPKERYAKRRLTSPKFLEAYDSILKEGGKLIFKTDNEGLFRYSIATIEESPYFQIEEILWDLHRAVASVDNVMTEYEKKFAQQGHPIYRLIAGKGKEKDSAVK